MKYSLDKLVGVPLLTLGETGVLNKQFWLDHGAIYTQKPRYDEKQCIRCGMIGKRSVEFLTRRGEETFKCRECRWETASVKEEMKFRREERATKE